jgi:hypothetical protein
VGRPEDVAEIVVDGGMTRKMIYAD